MRVYSSLPLYHVQIHDTTTTIKMQKYCITTKFSHKTLIFAFTSSPPHHLYSLLPPTKFYYGCQAFPLPIENHIRQYIIFDSTIQTKFRQLKIRKKSIAFSIYINIYSLLCYSFLSNVPRFLSFQETLCIYSFRAGLLTTHSLSFFLRMTLFPLHS